MIAVIDLSVFKTVVFVVFFGQSELNIFLVFVLFLSHNNNWRASEASETLSGLFNRESYIIIIGRAKRAPHWGVQSRFRVIYIGECGSTLYVGLSRMVRNLIQKSTV